MANLKKRTVNYELCNHMKTVLYSHIYNFMDNEQLYYHFGCPTLSVTVIPSLRFFNSVILVESCLEVFLSFSSI